MGAKHCADAMSRGSIEPYLHGPLQPLADMRAHVPSNRPHPRSCAVFVTLVVVTPSRYCGRVFDEAVISEAGRRLLEAAPPNSRVILFGSHARGEAGEHSDLDFLVIEPSVDDVVEETYRLRCTLRGLNVFVDIVVVTDESVREWRDVYGTVIHAALDEGRELAGAHALRNCAAV